MNILEKFKIGYWNIGIIENNIDEIMNKQPYSIRWMKHGYRDRFFADPFLYKKDRTNYYILAEELIFKNNKGTIVLLTVDRKSMKLIDRKLLIEDKYHLSYPNYQDGIIVAENFKSGGLYSFKLNNNIVEKKQIMEIALIDPTLVKYGGKKWLFGTTKEKEDDAVKKLSIFYEENGKYVPHRNNPVKIDINTARPGGNFFWYKNELYRPAQNSEHIYGEDIRIMKIKRLDEDIFEEEQVLVIDSHSCDRYNLGLHTFNVYDNFIIIDGFEYSMQIFQKLKNKIMKY